jgi:AcrR family transcriptional regulator
MDPLLTIPTTRKARATYERLVEAVRADINESAALSPERAAARAEVASATFYTYFQNKDDAIAAAFDQVLIELNSVVDDELAIEALLDHGLAEVMERAVSRALAGFRKDALVFRLALARLPERRLIRDVYRRREDEALESIRRFVELGIAANHISPGDPEATAAALLVALQGLNNHLLLHGDPPAAVVGLLVDMLVTLLSPSAESA